MVPWLDVAFETYRGSRRQHRSDIVRGFGTKALLWPAWVDCFGGIYSQQPDGLDRLRVESEDDRISIDYFDNDGSFERGTVDGTAGE